MAEAGLLFYRMSDDTVRLVTSFQTTDDEVDEALQRMGSAIDVCVRKIDTGGRVS